MNDKRCVKEAPWTIVSRRWLLPMKELRTSVLNNFLQMVISGSSGISFNCRQDDSNFCLQHTITTSIPTDTEYIMLFIWSISSAETMSNIFRLNWQWIVWRNIFLDADRSYEVRCYCKYERSTDMVWIPENQKSPGNSWGVESDWIY